MYETICRQNIVYAYIVLCRRDVFRGISIILPLTVVIRPCVWKSSYMVSSVPPEDAAHTGQDGVLSLPLVVLWCLVGYSVLLEMAARVRLVVLVFALCLPVVRSST